MILVISLLSVVLVLILLYRAKQYADYADSQIKLAESWMSESLRLKREAVTTKNQADLILARTVQVTNEKLID